MDLENENNDTDITDILEPNENTETETNNDTVNNETTENNNENTNDEPVIDESIKTGILNKLQGYILTTDITENTTDMDYDNSITPTELILFYEQSLLHCLSFCYLDEPPKIPVTPVIHTSEDEEDIIEGLEDIEPVMVIHPSFLEAVFMWAAGLIWRKYDVRANNTQIEDDGYVVSYGDQLIIDAKKQLQPHKYKDFGCW